jgi:predicted flap endonuclease-1-like 5' DNA nuclease
VHRAQSTEAAATASTTAVIQQPVATQPSTVQDAAASPKTASPTPASHHHTVNVVHANGYTNQRHAENPQTAALQRSAAAHQAITSNDLDALAASINELISTLNRASAETKKDAPMEGPLRAAHSQAAPTPPSGRMERILVRLVQAMAQFVRQVRAIISGRETPAPVPGARAPGADDLTRIDGLTPEYAERLRVAGVTTFERLAALSPDELRLLTLTPGGAAVDVERWRTQAARLSVIRQEPFQP